MASFGTAVFLSAFLLFEVQLILGKRVLPWFGGVPAVWTTCMLFFQVLLLLGYLYAHGAVRRLSPRRQARLHLVLLATAVAALLLQTFAWGLPLLPDATWKPADAAYPVARILKLLAASAGLPVLLLSTSGPLLSGWFAEVHPERSPYPLYALSNAGSLLALVGYPFLVEPALSLRRQAVLWGVGFLMFALAAGVSARKVSSSTRKETLAAEEPVAPPRRARLLWVLLSAGGVVLLLATTNQLCQEVAVVPFLWVLPLALYLLTFILCFESDRFYTRGPLLVAFIFALALGATALFLGLAMKIGLQVLCYAFVLFVGCMVCHGELVRLKPAPAHLTTFYLHVAAGGALGGVLVGLLAPLLFPAFWEFQVGLAFVAGLVAVILIQEGEPFGLKKRKALVGFRAGLVAGWALLAVALGIQISVTLEKAVLLSRSFYGALTVTLEGGTSPGEEHWSLKHGRIAHGFQYAAPARRLQPTTYYTEASGVGLVLRNHPRRFERPDGHGPLRVGAVGLGVGTIAAYGQEGDVFRFYEINPDVVRLSRGKGATFSFLSASRARIEVVLGDARLSLERELAEGGSQEFDLLVLDAFTSDAIPVHLLTREAFGVYRKHLRLPDGVLAIHLSNRYLNLLPVVEGLARNAGLRLAFVTCPRDGGRVWASDWALVPLRKELLAQPAVAAALDRTERPHPQIRLFTDDYSNLFQVLR